MIDMKLIVMSLAQGGKSGFRLSRIQSRSRESSGYGGYHGDTADICRAKSIKRNRIMKTQNLHDRAIRSRGEKWIPSIRGAATIHTVQGIRDDTADTFTIHTVHCRH